MGKIKFFHISTVHWPLFLQIFLRVLQFLFIFSVFSSGKTPLVFYCIFTWNFCAIFCIVLHLSLLQKLAALQFTWLKEVITMPLFGIFFLSISQCVHISSNTSGKRECICSVSRYGMSSLGQISRAVDGWMVSLSAVMSLTLWMSIHNIPSDRTARPRIHHSQMITVSAPQTRVVTYGRGFISLNVFFSSRWSALL